MIKPVEWCRRCGHHAKDHDITYAIMGEPIPYAVGGCLVKTKKKSERLETIETCPCVAFLQE